MERQLLHLLEYYQELGAPAEQSVLIDLLREIQSTFNGGIPKWVITESAAFFKIKENFLLAFIKLIPSLRLSDSHCLEICSGPNCSKCSSLRHYVTQRHGKNPQGFDIRYTGCMHMCNKGPNIRWDGTVYHHADEALIQKLVES